MSICDHLHCLNESTNQGHIGGLHSFEYCEEHSFFCCYCEELLEEHEERELWKGNLTCIPCYEEILSYEFKRRSK